MVSKPLDWRQWLIPLLYLKFSCTPKRVFSSKPSQNRKVDWNTSFLISSLRAVTAKLNEDNFHDCRAQVLFTGGVHELEDLLTRVLACTSPFVLGITVKQTNPQFHAWKRYDKLLSWLLALVFETMFSVVSKCETSNEVWCVGELFCY